MSGPIFRGRPAGPGEHLPERAHNEYYIRVITRIPLKRVTDVTDEPLATRWEERVYEE